MQVLCRVYMSAEEVSPVLMLPCDHSLTILTRAGQQLLTFTMTARAQDGKGELYHWETRGSQTSIPLGHKDSEMIGHAGEVREDGFNYLDEGFDAAEVKRVTRKVDWHLIPMLVAMYFVSQADRTNLSQARAANKQQMQKDLKLSEGNNR